MEVQFKRTGERRYAVTIFREGYPTIEMNPAPGYDPIMPHDLAHLIVEKEIGLRRGIFGQLAAGGNAGTFHSVPSAIENKREASRLRRKAAKRGEKLLREGRDESAISERAVDVYLNEWFSRSTEPNRKKMAVQLPPQRKKISEDDALTSEKTIERVCASLEWASERWASLKIGESFSVLWPDQPGSKSTARKLENAD